MGKQATILIASLATTGLVALGAPAATASHGGGNDGRVVKTGNCSDSARWKLKVKRDNGGLEVEGEVDSNQSGQAWTWRIKDNGSVAAKGAATTGGASGSFSVDRRIADKAGTDTIVFRAKYQATGEVCKGTIAF